jgi:hypothetical protein
MTLTETSSCGSLAISSWTASKEPDTSALSTSASSVMSAPRCWSKIVSSENFLPPRRACCSSLRRLARSPRERAGGAVVLDDADELAGLGDGVEPEHLDRHRGTRGLHARAVEVVHRRTRPQWAPATTASPTFSVPRWTRTVTTAPRPGSSLDSMTWPGGVGVRVGLELLDLGQQQDRLHQLVEVLLRLGRHVDEHGVAAPLLGLQAEAHELRADALGLRALLVDLVDGHEHRHVGGLRVVDRLAGLRHHAVVGGDDDDDDVGHLGAAGAHGGERLVARRVQEGDRLLAVVHLVGADVLGDAAGLARDDVRLADRVEQRRLAVVDVTHDRDDGRAVDEILGIVVERGLRVDLVGRVDDLDLLVELVRDHLHGIVGEGLGERRHLAQLHQLLDDVRNRYAEVLGDVLDGRARVDLDDVGLQDGDVLRHRLLVGAAPAPAATTRRASLRAATRAAGSSPGSARAACGLRVDHDAAHAAGGAGSTLALQRRACRPPRAVLAVALGVVGLGLLLLGLRALGRARASGSGGSASRARRASRPPWPCRCRRRAGACP